MCIDCYAPSASILGVMSCQTEDATVLAIDDEPAMTEWLQDPARARRATRCARRIIGTRGEEIFRTWRPDAVVTDMMLPDVDGIELVRTFKELDPEAEVIVITGQGEHPAGGRGGQGRRVRLPREAGRRRAAARQAREGDRAEGARRRERAAEAEAAGPLQVPEHHRQEQEDAGAVRAGRERGGERGEHPHPGRERHRQGADRQRHPLQQQAVEGAVHQDQLRGDSEGPHRVRAVRLQEGRVHRRDDRQGRAVRDGRGRLAAARRDRRDAVRTCRPSCCACCRSASTGRSAAIGSCTWTSG